MKLRVLGILSVLSVLIVIFASTAILASASRELTQELQINRAAALNRLAQVAFDAATDGESHAAADRDGQILGTVWRGRPDPAPGRARCGPAA